MSYYETINLPDGTLIYWQDWLDARESSELFLELRASIDWQHDKMKMFGKTIYIPRLQAFYGNKNINYQYSGIGLKALPWLVPLSNIRDRINKTTRCAFNSVLANLYRSGKDSNGWHADDEYSLGDNPVIASLSLGSVRRFGLKHKKRKDYPVRWINLLPGSLLLMGEGMQACWMHQVPKTACNVKERINLTFRSIVR